MSKATETKEENQQITLTPAQLQTLLDEAEARARQFGNANINDTLKPLIEAIIESRKPYVDPKNQENEQKFKTANKESLTAQKENTKRYQDSCPHVKGLAGQRPGSESSFWLHRLDTGEMVGICSFCQKVISSLVPEDQRFFAMKGDNAPSAAGQRQFLHPVKAMTARFSEEERKVIVERLNRVA